MSSIGPNGAFAQSGSTLFLVGGSSGLDTNALIEAAVQQRLREAVKLDVKIDNNLLKFDGYDKLQALGSSLQASLTSLRQSYGFSSTDGSVYSQKTGTLTSSSSTDPTSLIKVALDSTAVAGTDTIIVTDKARNNIVTSDATTDPNAALGLNGSFRLRLAGQAQVDINIVAGDTLTDIANKITAIAASTGVSAEIVKVNETNYKLVVNGDKTGLNIQREGITGDDVLQTIGVLDGASAYKNVAQNSAKARLTLNGVDIARDSNTINDLIPGVTIDIKNADPGTTITLEVGQDSASIKAAILDFVDSYNALRDFVIQNQKVNSDGSIPEGSVLKGDNLLSGINSQIQNLFGLNFNTGAQETLAEIGIEFDENNRLVVDELILDTAILDDPDVVQSLFQTQFTSDNAELNILKNNSTQLALNFALDITHDGTNITSVSIGGDNTLFSFAGGTITGNAGTIYQGITLAYIGTTNTTVNIGLDQGFADLAVNTLEGYVNGINGLIQTEKLNIESVNESLSDRAARVRERAEDFRATLIEKYARFEAQLSSSKAAIRQIRAILGTNDDS